jgi:3-oxoadipate enol-lactonase
VSGTPASERVLRGNPTDWAATWRAFKGLDVQDRLATLEPPTLVLRGEADAATILEPEIIADIAKRIPGGSYQDLRGAPHANPEKVVDALPAQWCRAHPCQ